MGAAERALALAVALGGAGVLIATANYGGRLVFDHAAGIPTEVLTTETQERTKGHHHAPGEEHGDGAEDHADDGHSHDAAPMATDSAAPAGAAESDHVDPPGTPPHSHEPKPKRAGGAQSSARHTGARALVACASAPGSPPPRSLRPVGRTPPVRRSRPTRRPRASRSGFARIEATRRLAEALQADSIPPSRVRLRDGYIETAWLDSATDRPTTGGRSAPASCGCVPGPTRADRVTRC